MLSTVVIALATSALVTSSPVKRWYPNSVGANYVQTNGFYGNELVASYIMPDGTLAAGTTSWTNGNGSAGINDPAPFENHPDPFYGSGSVIVVGNQVMVVNAGSNTFSTFDIDPSDPARPTFNCTYPSNGEFPMSLAASPDGSLVCVLNSGAKNGFSCYQAGDNGWAHVPAWDRDLGLNLTTPPHGPLGGTASQMTFAPDMSALIVVVKAKLPTDLNNPSGMMVPGYLATYNISGSTLSQDCDQTPAGAPFSIGHDASSGSNFYFLSDAATGYAVFEEGYPEGTYQPGVIPNEAASCWAVQSPLTKSYYTIDIGGKSNITEVQVDPTTLNGTIITHHGLGVNASGTDASIFSSDSVDWMYVNAAAYGSVHAFAITGRGDFSLYQRFSLEDMLGMQTDATKTLAGQAVYYKPSGM